MRLLPGSVRFRTTAIATVMTAIVLVAGAIVITQLVERSLIDKAESSFASQLDEASLLIQGERSGRQFAVEMETRSGDLIFVFYESNGPGAPVFNGVLVEPDTVEAVALMRVDAETLRPIEITGLDGSDLSSTYAPEELAESIQEREYPEDDDQVSLSEEAIEGIQADVSAVERVLVFIIPVLVSILGLGVWILVGRALRPVQSIAGQVSEITASTLDERVPVPDSKDEIADLANLMNAMLDRIEEGTTLQRRFVADASHELRSPLSTIKVAAEIAQVSPDPQKLQHLAGEVEMEASRMEALLFDLLELAKMDEQRSSEAMQQCDVVELVERTVDRVSASDCEISLSHDEHAVIAGSEAQIERAVLNLLENAALHAESKVRVEVEQVGTSVRVAVEDDGPGIALEDRERVFDRFVRLDESRSRTTGGTGIGLSIVLAVATRHHGSVVVEESPELGGARFVMTLN